MKRVFFILTLLFVIGCNSDNSDDTHNDPQGGGSDDDQGQTELVLLKYTHTTFNEFPQPEDLIYDFNADGSIDRFKIELNNGASTGYDQYVYDTNGRLTQVDHYSDSGDLQSTLFEYQYDGQGRLSTLIDFASQGANDPQTTNFEWDGNTVNFEEAETGKTGYIIFDGANRILETNHNSGPDQFTKSVLTYDGMGQITEVNNYVNESLSYTITLEYDDQINPLYPAFANDPLVYLAQGIYDLDFTGTINPYSMHNVTRELIPGFNSRDDQTTYQYNSEGYPTMGTTLRNGTLRAEHKFDY